MVSLKDDELGLKSPMESFPSINLLLVAGSEYACLSQRLHSLLSAGTQNDTDLFGTRL